MIGSQRKQQEVKMATVDFKVFVRIKANGQVAAVTEQELDTRYASERWRDDGEPYYEAVIKVTAELPAARRDLEDLEAVAEVCVSAPPAEPAAMAVEEVS